jgi:hypothetical protein
MGSVWFHRAINTRKSYRENESLKTASEANKKPIVDEVKPSVY